MLCSYGCGQEAKFQMSNKKWCCGEFYTKCPELRKKNTSIKGRIAWNKGIHCHSKEVRKIISEKNKGKKHSLETRKKISDSIKGKPVPEGRGKNISKSLTGRKLTEDHKLKIKLNSKHIKHTEEWKENQRQRMLNGGSVHASSFIKNPSKPQVELYNIIKKLYPSTVLNYPFYPLNYSLDVAIPDLKIWFESDGSHWHQDKEADLKRQKRIEELGWKVIRYRGDSVKDVPSISQIKEDIQSILELEKSNDA